ncbi:hypothetical protein [Nostoc sp.]
MENFLGKSKLWINNAKILTNRPYNTPEPSVTTSFQTNSLNIKIDSEDWGYVFLGSSAIDSLIGNIEGQAAVESYPDYTVNLRSV